jgi:hypothetical protein
MEPKVVVNIDAETVLYTGEDGVEEVVQIIEFCDENGDETMDKDNAEYLVAGPTMAGKFLAIDLTDDEYPIMGEH